MEYHGVYFTEEDARKWSKERIKEEISGLRERLRELKKEIEKMERKAKKIPPTWGEDYQEATKKIIRHEGYVDDCESAIAFLKSLL